MIRRDLLIARHNWKELLCRMGFFSLVLLVFVLLMGNEKGLPEEIAVGSYWGAFLLSLFLGSEKIFAEEFQEGILDEWLVSAQSPSTIVTRRWFSSLLVHLILYVPVAPLFGCMAGFSTEKILLLVENLFLILPGLTMLSTLIGVLTMGMNHSPLLVPLLILPLVMPFVIFSTLFWKAMETHLEVSPYIYGILGCSFLLFSLLYGLGGLAFKDSLEDR